MKHSKIYLSLLMILSFCCLLYGQTAQEILAKNVEARGGIKHLSSVKTIKYTGTFKQPGIDADLTMYFKSPDKILLDAVIGKIKAKIGCDDRTLWKQNPGGTPKEMPRSSDRLTVAFAEYHAFLFAYRDKGYEFELIGIEKFEGAEVFKVKVNPEKGDTIYLLIDSKNYLLLGFYIEIGEGARDAFYFTDFKETDGILLPYYMEARKSIGEITKCEFEKIETNAEVDEIIFNLPGSQPVKDEQKEEKERIPLEYSYRIPEQIKDGWETASLTDVGIKTEPIIDLMNSLLNRSDHSIHSILIIKNGKLVFEEYFKGRDLNVNEESLAELVAPGSEYSYTEEVQFDWDTLHFQASVTKSITSLLVGIAIDKEMLQRGLLEDAQRNDVEVISGTFIHEVEKKGETVTVRDGSREYEGIFVIAADGLNSKMAQRLGFNKEREFRGTLRCLFWHVTGVEPPAPDALIHVMGGKEAPAIFPI